MTDKYLPKPIKDFNELFDKADTNYELKIKVNRLYPLTLNPTKESLIKLEKALMEAA